MLAGIHKVYCRILREILFKLPLNSERLQKLTESYVVSNDMIVKAIGKPLPFSAEEGFKKTFQSFHNGQ